ncbi:hypothetical protein F4777DRAFT_575224 [Nemania sp. FL0916]|nr:hypothetical protein F4777DRAFT_575224 [Nemania sp. FL0916]
METQNRVYRLLAGKDIAPKFLGHIHGACWVIGFPLEKILNGLDSKLPDLEICKTALCAFHALEFVHEDCNKYTFILCSDGRIVLVDFDNAKARSDPAVIEEEIANLEAQLAETTGRGGGLQEEGRIPCIFVVRERWEDVLEVKWYVFYRLGAESTSTDDNVLHAFVGEDAVVTVKATASGELH